MKKYKIIICALILLFLLCGCSDFFKEDTEEYIYEINLSATPTAINVSPNIILGREAPGGGVGLASSIYIYKKYSDDHYESVEGIWSVEPSSIAFCDVEGELTHGNYINFTRQGSGKLFVYIPEDEVKIEKNVGVYGATNVSNYQNGECPQTIDFSSEISEYDLMFEGTKIFANSIVPLGETSLSEIKEIPRDFFSTIVDFESISEPSVKTFVVKTKEGYYVKLAFGGYKYNLTSGELTATIYYLIEKDPNATEFAY